MPSLKLSNPFRRGADRPSLKDRAASLKATAARVMSRKAADPVLAAIGRYQAARAAWDAHSSSMRDKDWDTEGDFSAEMEEDLRLGHVCSDICTEALGLTPATNAGRLALADFIDGWVAEHGNTDGSRQDGSDTVFAEVYPALLRAVRSHKGEPVRLDAAPKPYRIGDSLDFSNADIRTLAAIHEAARLIGDVAVSVNCQPRAFDSDGKAWNAAGLFADAISEACYSAMSGVVHEARKRVPSDDGEQTLRLGIIARDAIENGDRDAATAFAREILAMS